MYNTFIQQMYNTCFDNSNEIPPNAMMTSAAIRYQHHPSNMNVQGNSRSLFFYLLSIYSVVWPWLHLSNTYDHNVLFPYFTIHPFTLFFSIRGRTLCSYRKDFECFQWEISNFLLNKYFESNNVYCHIKQLGKLFKKQQKF